MKEAAAPRREKTGGLVVTRGCGRRECERNHRPRPALGKVPEAWAPPKFESCAVRFDPIAG